VKTLRAVGWLTTRRVVLELGLVGLEALAEMLLVESEHVSFREYNRDVCGLCVQ
jgi:hypothetical protein